MSAAGYFLRRVLTLYEKSDSPFKILWNCLGLFSLLYGHNFVPWPPALTMNFIIHYNKSACAAGKVGNNGLYPYN
ncbi:MAG: hypothetical protein UV25_C0040G0001 [candidate division WWE3 bacterium GW2011_GWB1_42_41]|nr:MAG: hypothetical protein UV25_C0040G0001 [candidate division WWE3 bacterium GW2011_GWB1_42_41]